MIKILLISLLFIDLAYSSEKMVIDFSESKVKQGTIVSAILELNVEAIQKVNVSQLKNVSLGDVFYIQSIKPMIRKAGEDNLKFEANVIVAKIPESSPALHKVGDSQIEIVWDQVEFIPTAADKNLIYENFSIPERMRVLFWFSLLLVLLILAYSFIYFQKKLKHKRRIKKLKTELKESVLSGTDYNSIVRIWEKKSTFVNEFSHLDEPFKELEKVLFKYQFKKTQTEAEKAEVITAYKKFINQVQGGFNGI